MPLAGTRILVVEDNQIVAGMVADALSDAGASVLGPYPNIVDALENLTELVAIDGAVLDIGLGEEESYPLAYALKTTRVPYMFLTGVERDHLPEQFTGAHHMLKPFRPAALVDMLLSIGVRDN